MIDDGDERDRLGDDIDFDTMGDAEVEELRSTLRRRARTQGVLAAFRSALRVCEDPKAPAQAQASSQRTLMQIGGFLDRIDRDSGRPKDPSEMTAAELQQSIDDLRRGRPSRPTASTKPKVGGLFD